MKRWLPPLLYRLTLGMAAALVALVIVAPFVDDPGLRARGWWWLVAAFARDTALRRTAIATALGLATTATIFFRPAPRTPVAGQARKPQRSQPPPPRGVAGA